MDYTEKLNQLNLLISNLKGNNNDEHISLKSFQLANLIDIHEVDVIRALKKHNIEINKEES